MLRRKLNISVSRATAPSWSQESGYAFLMVLFMIVLIIAGSMVLIEKLATQGVRDREAEAVWRGNQYARAVRLYYHKTGRYPQTIDDLSKGMPDLHFLRQAYKNPLNKADGTWRFIYVNAAGQIIGSTRYANLQQMMIIDSGALAALSQAGQQSGQPGIPAGSLSNTSNSDASQTGQTLSSPTSPSNNSSGSTLNPPLNPSGDNSQNPQNSTSTQSPQNPSSTSPFGQSSTFSQSNTFSQSAGQSGQSGQATQSTQTLASMQALLQLKPTGPVDGPVLGAFLTGVGGKGDQASLRVYHGGKKYLDWEFIWNPLEDAAAALQQGLGGQAQQPTGLPSGILGNVPLPLGPTVSQPGPSQPQQQQSQPQFQPPTQ
jgi:hypothetical protein